MSEELKPAAVHDANVFLPGSLGPVRREVVLAYEHDRVVNQLRAELAALKAGQGEAVAFDYPEFHAQGMGCGLEDRGIADRYEAMEYGFREGVYQTAMTIESMGPLYTTPPASADAVSVAPGLERAIQIVREVAKTQPGYSDEREAIFEALSEAYVEAKAPQHPPASADAVSVPIPLLEQMALTLNRSDWRTARNRAELRALLAQSGSKGVKSWE